MKKGVTLVEVLVAIFMFSTSIVILLSAVGTSTMYTARARNREAAIFAAKARMEELFDMSRNDNFDGIDDLDGTSEDIADEPLSDFSGQVGISVVEYTHEEGKGKESNRATIGADECWEVLVTVTWRDFVWSGLRLQRAGDENESSEILATIVRR